jgi:hypothetical protein
MTAAHHLYRSFGFIECKEYPETEILPQFRSYCLYMEKTLVSLPDGVVKTLDTELVGKIGQTRSDTLRTIIMNWLSEKGYLAKGGKVEKRQS